MAGGIISYAEAHSANNMKWNAVMEAGLANAQALFDAWKAKFGIVHAAPYPPPYPAPEPPTETVVAPPAPAPAPAPLSSY
jgi:hypothetical protein